MACLDCGALWTAEDTNIIKCPECASLHTMIKRCPGCPQTKLEELRAKSDAGQLLDLVLALEEAATTFRVDWGEVPAEQAAGLHILREERAKLQKEQQP